MLITTVQICGGVGTQILGYAAYKALEAKEGSCMADTTTVG